MVNKNKFINSTFIVLEHDFPFQAHFYRLLLHCRLRPPTPGMELFSLATAAAYFIVV